MENALMVGLARQLVLQRAMDVTANNLANMSTTGFKLETPVLTTEAEEPDGTTSSEDINFATDWSVLRDFSEGPLQPTGRPFDLAIKGDGFFSVETAEGEPLYTRDGRFLADAEGRLVTAQGYAVLGDGGGEIVLPPNAASVTITAEGGVEVDGAQVGRIGVVRFESRAVLEKTGDGLFRATDGASPDTAENVEVRQGFLESSNVQPIVEITRMIEITRAYEAAARMIQAQEDLTGDAIDTLGSVT